MDSASSKLPWITSTLSHARFGRMVAVSIAGALELWAVVVTLAIYGGAEQRGEIGYDAWLIRQIGAHFVETGQPYYPSQLAGPYPADGTVNVYPPTALYLFVPASFMPAWVWWVVPIGVVCFALYRLRPAPWTWPLMALGCVLPIGSPTVPIALVYGGTLLWTLAALFAAAAFRPGIAWLVAFKPVSLPLALPFALRSWRGLVAIVFLSAILLPYWFDWLIATQNMRLDDPVLYTVAAWPALSMPLVAWLGRSKGSAAG